MPCGTDTLPAKVVALYPLTKGEKVDGVYVADTNTLEDAGIGGFAMYPSDL